LITINLQLSKREEIEEALQLKRSTENCEFVFLLVRFSKIREAIDLALNNLQYCEETDVSSNKSSWNCSEKNHELQRKFYWS